jgi:hypothetical protein
VTEVAAPQPVASGIPGISSAGGAEPPRPGTSDACPLCGSALHHEQEWCLRCGAAARTRLAATPNWRAPIAAIVAVSALSLGVLTAALIDLAGGSGPTKTQVTRTVTTGPAAVAPAPTATTTTAVTPTTAVPGAVVPGAVAPRARTPSTRTAPPPVGGTASPNPAPVPTTPRSGTLPPK